MKVPFAFEQVSPSADVLLNNFALVSERSIASAAVSRRVSSKDGVHVPSSSSLGASLEGLREGVLLIGLSKHFSIRIAENFSGVDAPEHEVGMPVYVGEEVLSPPGMLESGRDKGVQLVVVGIKRVHFVVEVVFESVQLILLLIEVIFSLLNELKLGNMLLVIHNFLKRIINAND